MLGRTMFKYLNTWKQAKELAQDELKTFVQDKSKPLDERWALFMQYGDDLAGRKGWLWHPDALDKFSGTRNQLEDNFYDGEGRGSTIEIERWVEYLQDVLADGETVYNVKKHNPEYRTEAHDESRSFSDQYYIRTIETLTQEDIDNLKEEAMQEFIYSFEFDW